MAEQDILFFLNGDAQGAIDALTSLIDVVKMLDEALQGVAGSLGILNDVEAALSAMGANEAGISATADAVVALDDALASGASLPQVYAQGLNEVDAASQVLEANAANIAQVMNAQASAMIADAQAAVQLSDSITASATGFAELDAVLGETAQLSDQLSQSLALDVEGLGLTADSANVFVDALMQVGASEQEALTALDEYYAGVLTLNDVNSIFGTQMSLSAQSVQQFASAMTPAVESVVAMSAAIDPALTTMVDFTTGMFNAEQAEASLASSSTSAAMSMEELTAIVEQLYVAVGEVDATVGGVSDALLALANAGVDAGLAFDVLEQVCATLGVDFGDLLASVDALQVSMGLVAPAADAFTSSFTQAQMAAGLFGQSLSQIPGAVMEATASLGEMEAAESSLTVASDAKTASVRTQGEAMQTDAYMVLVLLQFLLQAVGGFVQMGTAAQDSIAKLSGLADQSLAGAAGMQRLNGVVNQLEQDSMRFGVSLSKAADGLYFIMSAGFNTADSLKILQYSMEASAATGAQMDTVSSALTSILNAYGLTAKSAGLITNEMVQSIVSGKMKAQDYANAIGNLSAVAHQTGFTFIEATSALSTFTQINGRTRQDAQNLAQMFQVLGLRADDIAKAAKGLNISFDETAFKSMDLEQKLQYLAKIAGGDNTTAFQKLMLNATAARSAFELLSNNGTNLQKVLSEVSGSTHALDTAFAESEKTITAAVNHMQAAMSVLAYQLTVLATPAVQATLGAITQAIEFLTQHTEILIPVMTTLAMVVGSLLAVSFELMLKMMMPAITIAINAYGPLILLVGVAMLLAEGIRALAASSPPLQAALTALGQEASVIGSTLGGMFNTAVQRAGQLLVQLGAWIQGNVIPPLTIIMINLVQFAQVMGLQVVPSVQGVLSALQPLGAFILGSVVPVIGQLITEALRIAVVISGNLVPIFAALRNAIIPLASIIAGFAAAWALIQLAGVIQGLITVVAVISVGLIPALGAVIAELAAAAVAFIVANAPLILIGAALALAVAGFIHLYQTSAPVRAVVAQLGQAFQAVGALVMGMIVPVFQQLWATVQTQLVPAWQQLVVAVQPLAPYLDILGHILGGLVLAAIILVVSALVGLIAGIAQFAQGLIQFVGGVVQIISGLIQFIAAFLTAIRGMFTGNNALIEQSNQMFAQALQTIWSGLGNALMGILRAVVGTLAAIFFGFINTVITFFEHLASVLVGHSIWPDMLNAMVQVLTAWVSQVLSAFAAFVGQIIAAVTSFASQMQAIWRTTWAAIQVIWQTVLAALAALLSGNFARFVALISQAGAQMRSTMQAAWSAIQAAVQAGISNIIAAVQGFVARLGSIFAGLAASAWHWGADFMGQMAAGVASAGQGVVAAAQNIAGQVASLLHFSVPDEGPLADADKWGPDFGDLLAGGLNDQVNKVGNAASRIANSISIASPNPGDFARFAQPAPTASANDTASLQILQAILAELQSQTGHLANNRLSIGHNLPSTSLGTVTQNFGQSSGITKIHEQYQQLNTLAGIAYENGVRGSITGLGV